MEEQLRPKEQVGGSSPSRGTLPKLAARHKKAGGVATTLDVADFNLTVLARLRRGESSPRPRRGQQCSQIYVPQDSSEAFPRLLVGLGLTGASRIHAELVL